MTDPTLISSAASGDEHALETLITESSNRVFAYLTGMLGDEREAADALQETYVRVARGVERYDASTDAEGWVLGIARRVADDYRPTPAAPPGEVPPTEGDVTEWARRSLRSLESELREVLVLKEVLRLQPDRIATLLGTTTDEISHRVLSAYAKVAEGMRGRPPSEPEWSQ